MSAIFHCCLIVSFLSSSPSPTWSPLSLFHQLEIRQSLLVPSPCLRILRTTRPLFPRPLRLLLPLVPLIQRFYLRKSPLRPYSLRYRPCDSTRPTCTVCLIRPFGRPLPSGSSRFVLFSYLGPLIRLVLDFVEYLCFGRSTPILFQSRRFINLSPDISNVSVYYLTRSLNSILIVSRRLC